MADILLRIRVYLISLIAHQRAGLDTEANRATTDIANQQEMITYIYKSAVSFFCLFGILILVVNSTWFTNLSEGEKAGIASIAALYLLLMAFGLLLTNVRRWSLELPRSLWRELGIRAIACGMILFLMDVFGDNHPGYLVVAVLVLAAGHFHYASYMFGVPGDYGLSQGLITIAITAFIHLSESGVVKYIVMVSGAVFLDLFISFQQWDNGTHTPGPEGTRRRKIIAKDKKFPRKATEEERHEFEDVYGRADGREFYFDKDGVAFYRDNGGESIYDKGLE